MDRKRENVPVWKCEIGERIRDTRMDEGLTQLEFAQKLEEYRVDHYPQFKSFTRNDVENLENGGKDIKVEHIMSICAVLGISCNYLLTGVEEKDKTVVDDLGLSGSTIISLRMRDFAGDTLSFFMDNHLIELLYELKRFIELDESDLQSYTGISKPEQVDLARFRFVEQLKTWRSMYRAEKRTKIARENRKNTKGGIVDDKEGKR